MENIIKTIFRYKDNQKLRNIFITLVGSTLYTVAMKWFIIPAGQKTGGFTGIAQLIANQLNFPPFDAINTDTLMSIFWIGLNIPVFYLGFKGVGKRFTILSLLSVIFGSVTLAIIPYPEVLHNLASDQMLCAITGGVVAGIGVGITLKVGSSTGGMDIVTQYIAYKKDGSFGQYSFILNTLIIAIAAFTDTIEIALYTVINLFISSIVIDKIHTRHNKLTLMIITDHKDEMVKAIYKRIYRGITVIPAQGGYSGKEKNMLFMVVSSYELYNVLSAIREIDPNSFTNVLKSQTVFGNFFKERVN